MRADQLPIGSIVHFHTQPGAFQLVDRQQFPDRENIVRLTFKNTANGQVWDDEWPTFFRMGDD